MSVNVREYKPRKLNIPTTEEAFLILGVDEKKKQYSPEGAILLNKRAFTWITRAVPYAFATLNLTIDSYPEEQREFIEPVLEELSIAMNLIIENNTEGDRREDFKTMVDAVAHAGNIFNNLTCLLPAELERAALEARDICDEAARQPNLI